MPRDLITSRSRDSTTWPIAATSLLRFVIFQSRDVTFRDLELPVLLERPLFDV